MSVQVKICGISTPDALDAALVGGASHVGFVFFEKSPRNVSHDIASALAVRAANRAGVVGLFVNPDPHFIDMICTQVHLDIIQLHGDEPPAFVTQIGQRTGLDMWKAIPVRTSEDVKSAAAYHGAAQRILYDAKPPAGSPIPGGTGMRFDWTLLNGVTHPLPWILAGGLDAANIQDAVGITGAQMIDVSSGIESAPGIKDVDKIAAFLKAAQSL